MGGFKDRYGNQNSSCPTKSQKIAFVKVKRKESKTTNNLHANNWNNSQGMEKRRTECARVRSLS